jgi:hypothetical protein
MPMSSPEVSSSAGGVYGAMLSRGTKQPFPVGLDLYLGEVLTSSGNKLQFAGLDRLHAPHAAPDAKGRFVFSKVKPGTYGLIATSPKTQVLVPDPKRPNQVVVVTVEANKQIDLGTLFLDLTY